MSSDSQLNAVDPETLSPCWGHSGLALEHLYIIWGGLERRTVGESLANPRNPSKIHVYNTHLKRWFCLQTSGECPMELMGTVAVIEGLVMCVVNPSFEDPQGPTIVYTLDLTTLVWTKLSSQDIKRPTPRVSFTSWIHENKLYMFGGHGPSPLSASEEWMNIEFLKGGYFDEESDIPWCFNNQLLSFDLQTYIWSSCEFSGRVPSPRASHRTCLMGDIVVLFGGCNGELKLNDLYTLDMKSFLWKRIDILDSFPCGRSNHSLSALSSRKLVMYGGLTTSGTLDDMWILDMISENWTHVNKLCLLRAMHSAVVIDSILYVFGTSNSGLEVDFFTDQDPNPTNSVEYNIGVPSLHNLCHCVISSFHDLYPPEKLTALLPNVESLRILASRGDSISSNQKPLLELMRY